MSFEGWLIPFNTIPVSCQTALIGHGVPLAGASDRPERRPAGDPPSRV